MYDPLWYDLHLTQTKSLRAEFCRFTALKQILMDGNHLDRYKSPKQISKLPHEDSNAGDIYSILVQYFRDQSSASGNSTTQDARPSLELS